MLGRVLALAQARDHRRAAALAEQALAEGFEHPLLFNVVATRLEEEGKLGEALRLLERAVELAPADVPARNALALVLQRLGRPQEALVHIEAILAQHPQLAFAHANKGNALSHWALWALHRPAICAPWNWTRTILRPWARWPRSPRTAATMPAPAAGRNAYSRACRAIRMRC